MGPHHAIVLAGGLGTRLRPVVQDRPKVLAQVNGRPFLAYLLDQLQASGVDRVTLSVGYLARQVTDAFGSSFGGMRIDYSIEQEPLGTGGAIRHALDMTTGDTVMVLNGDSYCEADLRFFSQAHRDGGFGASLVLAEVEDIGRFGQVELEAGSTRIARFSEKGTGQGRGLINAGIYLVKRELLAGIPEHRAVSLEREIFPFWLENGMQGVHVGRDFIDIGTPETYRSAEEFFRSRHEL